MTRQTYPQVMTLINPRTVIIGVNNAKIETISEKLAYRKFIKDLDFETSKVFERGISRSAKILKILRLD